MAMVIADWTFKAAHTGSVRPMAVLQVKKVVALLYTFLHCDPLIHNFTKSRDKAGIESFREHEISGRFEKFERQVGLRISALTLFVQRVHRGNGTGWFFSFFSRFKMVVLICTLGFFMSLLSNAYGAGLLNWRKAVTYRQIFIVRMSTNNLMSCLYLIRIGAFQQSSVATS